MAKRKTLSLEFLKNEHDRMTKWSLEHKAFVENPALGKAARFALNFSLETALFEANDYRGFQHLCDHTIDDTVRRYL